MKITIEKVYDDYFLIKLTVNNCTYNVHNAFWLSQAMKRAEALERNFCREGIKVNSDQIYLSEELHGST